MFLSFQHIKDVFRNGAGCVSDAVRGEDAYWALDEGLLIEMRGKGIRMVGVVVRETGDVYLTWLENFFGPKLARLSHPWVRADQRYLNLRHFQLRHGLAKV